LFRYEHVAHNLNLSGYSVYACDHQGHGQSQGTRCYVESFQTLSDDLLQFITFIQSKLSNKLPCFVLGSTKYTT
jgi:alpha-beta hydrolase superfamily lysophospholipase